MIHFKHLCNTFTRILLFYYKLFLFSIYESTIRIINPYSENLLRKYDIFLVKHRETTYLVNSTKYCLQIVFSLQYEDPQNKNI